MKKTLTQLYKDHIGKVSDKWTIYLTEYDRILDSYRDKQVRLLEVGVQNGGSLEIWSKYFPNAVKIIGCDINLDCKKLFYDDPRISVIVGDANSEEIRSDIFKCSPQFDIFIDDGSHTSKDIILSFVKYFELIADNGVYIAEDIHCSYWQEFGGGLFDPLSSISFFKRLADIASYEHWGVPKSRLSLLEGFIKKYHFDLDESQLAQIHSVEFINSLCVIRKSSSNQNILGTRFIAGQDESIVPGQLKMQSSLHSAVNQETNKWAARLTPPDEELELRIQEIARLKLQILNLDKNSEKLGNELLTIRSTKIWRFRTLIIQGLSSLITLFKAK